MAEFDIVLGLHRSNLNSITKYGSAYIEDEDDTSSIGSCSTNATMDDNPGAGLTIDKYFYQPVGHAVERFALKIAIRLNMYHPSPAHILRFLRLVPRDSIPDGKKSPSDVIADISVKQPSAVPGILSLVQQSQ